MLDLRALVDGTGNVADTALNTLAGNDGTPTPGTPFDPSHQATLQYVSWDGLVAGTPFKTLKLVSTDLPDPVTGYDLGASFAPDFVMRYFGIPYKTGTIIPRYSQTVAARLNAGLLWSYEGGPVTGMYPRGAPAAYSTTYGGALTAGTWGSAAFAPAGIPQGTYAINGAAVSAITTRALIRFRHADFGAYAPGFPVFNAATGTRTANETDLPEPVAPGTEGHQFDELSEDLGMPCVPMFKASATGTGLNIDVVSNTADTPKVVLYLTKVA